jgi:hypothetical protein
MTKKDKRQIKKAGRTFTKKPLTAERRGVARREKGEEKFAVSGNLN